MDELLEIVDKSVFLDNDDKYYKCGYNLLGPIFTLFVDWIHSYATEHNIRDVFFMLREGEMYHRLSSNSGNNINSHLLFISRFSLWSNTIQSENDFKQFILPYFGKLKAVKIIDWFKLESFDKNDYDFVITHDTYDIIKETFLEIILEKSGNGKRNLDKYLEKTFKNMEKCIVVNIGYGMTSHYFLSKLLPHIEITGLYICSHNVNKHSYNINNLVSRGFLVDNDDRHHIMDLFLRHNCWIEPACMGPVYYHSTVGYNENGEPIFGNAAKSEPEHIDKFITIQKGVSDFQQKWLAIKKQDLSSDDFYHIKDFLYNILMDFCYSSKVDLFDEFQFDCLAGGPTFTTGNSDRNEMLNNRMVRDKPKMVLFLCTANHFRSRFSEMYFNMCVSRKYLNWYSFSRALEYDKWLRRKGNISRHTLKFIKEEGMLFTDTDLEREPIPVTREDMEESDVIIAAYHMEHKPVVAKKFPEYKNKIVYWDIKDVRPSESYHPLKEIMLKIDTLLDSLI